MKKTTLNNQDFSILLDVSSVRALANAEDLKKIAMSKIAAPLGEAIAGSLKAPGPYRVRVMLNGPIEIKLGRDELEGLFADLQVAAFRTAGGM